MLDLSFLIPIFVISCIVVAVVIFTSLITGKHIPREAFTTYIVILGSALLAGVLIAAAYFVMNNI